MAEILLFFQFFLIFSICAAYVFVFYRNKSILQLLLDCSILALIFGIPILFTSLTRSVFEVTKMGLLRYSQLIMFVAIFLSFIFKIPVSFNQTNQNIEKAQKLNWIWCIWLIVNVLSFVFSPNRYVAWIGAYDRWEGIVTVVNYIVLFYLLLRVVNRSEQVLWFGISFLISGMLSSIYGAFQSTGHDFMNWSVDPTARVFASINNPVHYSAYVAMLVPVLIGGMFYWIKSRQVGWVGLKFNVGAYFKNKTYWIPFGLFVSALFFYYVSSFLSFGRATWIGFSVAMMFLYYFLLKLDDPNQPYFSALSYILGMFLAVAIFVFKVHEFSKAGLIAMSLITAVYLLSALRVYGANWQRIVSVVAVLIFFALLQFNTVSLYSIIFCLMCLSVLYAVKRRQAEFSKISLLMMFALMAILVLPSINSIYAQVKFNNDLNNQISKAEKEKNRKLNPVEKEQFRYKAFVQLTQSGQISKTELNVTYKTGGYASNLKAGTARTSMWRSAIGLSLSAYKDPNFHMWIKDYPLLGTGPCTIKCFFPRYRRPEYGRLEGGHNFTPDKLHNDYVNLIATNGVLGFSVYYMLFIPYCGYLFIKRLKEYPNAASNYLLIGLMSGLLVYLGQVMFNFGVVATRVLFYELLGIAMAIVLNNPFKDVKAQDQEDIK